MKLSNSPRLCDCSVEISTFLSSSSCTVQHNPCRLFLFHPEVSSSCIISCTHRHYSQPYRKPCWQAGAHREGPRGVSQSWFFMHHSQSLLLVELAAYQKTCCQEIQYPPLPNFIFSNWISILILLLTWEFCFHKFSLTLVYTVLIF